MCFDRRLLPVMIRLMHVASCGLCARSACRFGVSGFLVCCLLFAMRCLLCGPRYALCVVCCLLFVVCVMLCAACCCVPLSRVPCAVLFTACRLFMSTNVCCYVFVVDGCLMFVVCCSLSVACSFLFGAC